MTGTTDDVSKVPPSAAASRPPTEPLSRTEPSLPPELQPPTQGDMTHAGAVAVRAAQRHGALAMFTLSGAHVFPLYDGAVKAEPPLPLYDVRHEQSAVFAAEATAKLTRTPGLAVLTAGPGVTNGLSAITTAHFNGSPLVVLGGRAPQFRWGTGSLQELDQPPLFAPVTKASATATSPQGIADDVDRAFSIATSPHRGPVFLDIAMDHLFAPVPATSGQVAGTVPVAVQQPDDAALDLVCALLADAHHPLLILGSDVWTGGAEHAAAALTAESGLATMTNGMARGVIAPASAQFVTRARASATREADLVVVVGTPLDFRLGYGSFGSRTAPAKVVHLQDSPEQLAKHVELAAGVTGDLALILDGLRERLARKGLRPEATAWTTTLRQAHLAAIEADQPMLAADGETIHPGRIYGELQHLLEDDAVVIGDGGDFVSFAGRFLEPARPGGWLDPGPYGCLGTGMGYTMAARLARPQSQVVTLLGDGAAGMSLMDVDTLVRHQLPAVLVVGNNGMWGLEKAPMQMLYGYDVAAELTPRTRYDQVVTALGGGGEMVTDPDEVGPALRRALESGVPYCVNVITDPAVTYPRRTTGI